MYWNLLEICLEQLQFPTLEQISQIDHPDTVVLLQSFNTQMCPHHAAKGLKQQQATSVSKQGATQHSHAKSSTNTFSPGYKSNQVSNQQAMGTMLGLLNIKCQPEYCLMAHSTRNLRRPPFNADGTIAYLPIPCKSLWNKSLKEGLTPIVKQNQETITCPDGIQCKYAHSQSELDYHPLLYKTQPCEAEQFDHSGFTCCKRAFACPNYHSNKDKRDPKTHLAPKSQAFGHHIDPIQSCQQAWSPPAVTQLKMQQVMQQQMDGTTMRNTMGSFGYIQPQSQSNINHQGVMWHQQSVNTQNDFQGNLIESYQANQANFGNNHPSQNISYFNQQPVQNSPNLVKYQQPQDNSFLSNQRQAPKFTNQSSLTVQSTTVQSVSSHAYEYQLSNTQKDDLINQQESRKQIKQADEKNKSPSFIQVLDLSKFKTQKCLIISKNHNLKKCPDYHEKNKDRRRPLGNYCSELCAQIAKKKKCMNGDACTYCHTRVEEFYHPDKYKAKFCASFNPSIPNPIRPTCEYGEYCSFAHSESELTVDLLHNFTKDADFYMFHFKTVWCPFNDSNGVKHDKEKCVYAHHWQDFRRKPHIYKYSHKPCPQWDVNRSITDYDAGCQNGLRCTFAHGWTESDYHPSNYKRKQCSEAETLKSNDMSSTYTYSNNRDATCTNEHCPHYHVPQHQNHQKPNFTNTQYYNQNPDRILLPHQGTAQASYFQIVPKNRDIAFPSSRNYDNSRSVSSQSYNNNQNNNTVVTTQSGVGTGIKAQQSSSNRSQQAGIYTNRLPHTKINKRDLETNQSVNGSSDQNINSFKKNNNDSSSIVSTSNLNAYKQMSLNSASFEPQKNSIGGHQNNHGSNPTGHGVGEYIMRVNKMNTINAKTQPKTAGNFLPGDRQTSETKLTVQKTMSKFAPLQKADIAEEEKSAMTLLPVSRPQQMFNLTQINAPSLIIENSPQENNGVSSCSSSEKKDKVLDSQGDFENYGVPPEALIEKQINDLCGDTQVTPAQQPDFIHPNHLNEDVHFNPFTYETRPVPYVQMEPLVLVRTASPMSLKSEKTPKQDPAQQPKITQEDKGYKQTFPDNCSVSAWLPQTRIIERQQTMQVQRTQKSQTDLKINHPRFFNDITKGMPEGSDQDSNLLHQNSNQYDKTPNYLNIKISNDNVQEGNNQANQKRNSLLESNPKSSDLCRELVFDRLESDGDRENDSESSSDSDSDQNKQEKQEKLKVQAFLQSKNFGHLWAKFKQCEFTSLEDFARRMNYQQLKRALGSDYSQYTSELHIELQKYLLEHCNPDKTDSD